MVERKTHGCTNKNFQNFDSLELETAPPNILFFISDDQSWKHYSAYGDKAVKSPAFDQIAREGVLFNNAYTACPSCAPSRSAVLTGQHIWRLEEGGVFGCTLPRKFKTFPVLLEEAGYFSGWTGKGWGSGNLKAGGWGKDSPLGQCYNQKNINENTKQGLDVLPFDYAANFSQFLRDKPKDKLFFFWCGFGEPHRGYTKGSGLNSGMKLKDADLPEHLPDTPEIRSDILDYCREIEYLDSHVARILQTIRDKGLLDNTMVIITSDQGMPFPRSKPTLYDVGTHIPMAISWPKKIPGGIVVNDMVSLVDIAPTILEAADVEVPQEMNGKSLMKVLFSKNSGLIDSSRDWIVTALERHGPYRQGGVGYPCRAIQTKRYLYIWNIFPDREPSGKSEDNKYYPTRNPCPEIDPGPSKDFLIEHQDNPDVKKFAKLAFGKHPAEELYDKEKDPGQINNFVNDPNYSVIKEELSEKLKQYLRQTNDPRLFGDNTFDTYIYDTENWVESTFGISEFPH